MSEEISIAIIGGGLTGLSLAFHLEQAGFSPHLFESQEQIGGRVRSDNVDGFILDRGFQVIQTSYTEIWQILNKTELALKPFDCGALTLQEEKRVPVYHPFRHPLKWLASLWQAPGQAVAFARLFAEYRRYKRDAERWRYSTLTTQALLEALAVPSYLIESFFRPFFGGVFLEKELKTQAGIFMQRFHHFFWGEACLPAGGMGQLPLKISQKLVRTTIHTSSKAVHIEEKKLTLADGRVLQPEMIICCLDSYSAQKLFPHIPCHESVGEHCFYFSVDSGAIAPHKLLMLSGGAGPVNNLSINSAVQPGYAPKGKELIAAVVVGHKAVAETTLLVDVQRQTVEWLGIAPEKLSFLRSYKIDKALPLQDHPPPIADYHHPRIPGVYLAGEIVDSASINGSLASGRHMALRVLRDLSIK